MIEQLLYLSDQSPKYGLQLICLSCVFFKQNKIVNHLSDHNYNNLLDFCVEL